MKMVEGFVWALLASTALPPASVLAAEPRDARLPGGEFVTVLPPAADVKTALIRPFRMDRALVSNAEFARFVTAAPKWRRDGVARLFADTGYLEHWQGASTPGAAIAAQPVTHVSWFAASAYCEAQGKRLPRWHEWEYAAAASETLADARGDAAWRQTILDWYARSARGPLPAAGSTPANYFGVHDLHGVAWEWVEDAGGMLVSDDGREQGDGSGRFCGASSASFEQKENYAMLMRIAMLSSMKAAYTSSSMSFRCVTGEETR